MDNLCDRCGAAGKTRFVKGEQDLVFCGHHTQEYNLNLIAAGFENDTYMIADELVNA